MIKTRATNKEIKSGFSKIISVPYCAIQNLLKYSTANYYNYSTVYGWRNDIYVINFDTCIVTGYQPYGNIKPSAEILKKYESLAINELDKNLNYEAKKKNINNLLIDFINEIL